MATKSAVTISRQWHNPHIEIRLDAAGIEIEMPMTDFVDALAHEIAPRVAILAAQGQVDFLNHMTAKSGNPTWLFTKSQLQRHLLKGFDTEEARSAVEALLAGQPVIRAMREAAEAVFTGMKAETSKVV